MVWRIQVVSQRLLILDVMKVLSGNIVVFVLNSEPKLFELEDRQCKVA